MKTTFVEVNNINYIGHYDNQNIFFCRNDEKKRDKLVHIQLGYDNNVEAVKITVKGKLIDINVIDVDGTDPHKLIRAYAEFVEKLYASNDNQS